MKARRALIQVKHNLHFFSFRYLKKFLLHSSTIEVNRKLSRGTERTKLISQAAQLDTSQVKWPRTESSILRNHATPWYCWRHKLGHVGFQHQVHGHNFFPSPKSMPCARINGGCGVTVTTPSPRHQKKLVIRMDNVGRGHHASCKERQKLKNLLHAKVTQHTSHPEFPKTSASTWPPSHN